MRKWAAPGGRVPVRSAPGNGPHQGGRVPVRSGPGNGLRQGGRVPVRSAPGPPKLLHRPRTVFPSLLPNKMASFGREATGKQTMPGSVRQLPPPSRIEPERGDRALVGAAEYGWGLSGFLVRNFRSLRVIPAKAGIHPLVRTVEKKSFLPRVSLLVTPKIPRPRAWGACISFPAPPHRGSGNPDRRPKAGCADPDSCSP